MESPICHFIEGYRGKILRLSAWLTNLTPGCNPPYSFDSLSDVTRFRLLQPGFDNASWEPSRFYCQKWTLWTNNRDLCLFKCMYRAFLMLALSTTDVLRFAVPYTAALRIRLWCRAALRPPKHRRLNYFGSVYIAVTDLD